MASRAHNTDLPTSQPTAWRRCRAARRLRIPGGTFAVAGAPAALALMTCIGCQMFAHNEPRRMKPTEQSIAGLESLEVADDRIVVVLDPVATTLSLMKGNLSVADAIVRPGESFTLTDGRAFSRRYTLMHLSQDVAVLKLDEIVDRRAVQGGFQRTETVLSIASYAPKSPEDEARTSADPEPAAADEQSSAEERMPPPADALPVEPEPAVPDEQLPPPG